MARGAGRAGSARGASAGGAAQVAPAHEVVTLRVGPVAHGGHCVARWDGRVVFVRHTLPGELVRVRIELSAGGERYLRGDAVEVLEAAPGRVPVRCAVAGPGGCGGCDLQHVDLPTQRALKAEVVREQLQRLGRVPGDDPLVQGLHVRAVPGDDEGLAWRTRMTFAVDDAGTAGLRRHRSHEVVDLGADGCPLAVPAVNAAGVTAAAWPGAVQVDVAAHEGRALVVGSAPEGADPAGAARRWPWVRRAPQVVAGVHAVAGAQQVRLRGASRLEPVVRVGGVPRAFRVGGAGFWQVHPGAAQVLLDTVLELLAARPGERALDLYCGVGLFAAGLAAAVGAQGRVVAVEDEARAVRDARRNLHDLAQVQIVPGRVERVLSGRGGGGRAGAGRDGRGGARGAGGGPVAPDASVVPQVGPADVVVLDPPRAGAGRAVLEQVARRGPRAVAYVACDPASLGRDVAHARALGWRLAQVRAFDLFPMTAHVECVALFEPEIS